MGGKRKAGRRRVIREVSKPGTGKVVVHDVPEVCNSELLHCVFSQFKVFRRLISKNKKKDNNQWRFYFSLNYVDQNCDKKM